MFPSEGGGVAWGWGGGGGQYGPNLPILRVALKYTLCTIFIYR